MRVLLDESLPRPLGRLLAGHAVRTVGQAGWASFKNGTLLRIASADFDVLITADQNIEFQQNLAALPIAEPLVPRILEVLAALKPRTLVRVEA